MSVHVEWVGASTAVVDLIEPGALLPEAVGGVSGPGALVVGDGDVVVIEGHPDELRKMVDQMATAMGCYPLASRIDRVEELTTYLGDADGVSVVQIDTTTSDEGQPSIRVNLNDAPIWDRGPAGDDTTTLSRVRRFMEEALRIGWLSETGGALACSEAEAMAEVLRLLGFDGTAESLMRSHAESDEPGDAHYQDDDEGVGPANS